MKITILIIALSLIFTSCASKPSAIQKDLSNEYVEENIETEEDEIQTKNIKDDFEDLKESVETTPLPELHSIENVEKKEETEEDSIEEPLVKDIVQAEDIQEKLPEEKLDNENLPIEENLLPVEEDTDNEKPQNKAEITETVITAKEEDKSDTFKDTSLPIEETKENNEQIKPSRTMTIKKNQTIEVTYPGRGWVYQGNMDKEGNLDNRNKNFIFGGRKLGGQNQTFTLKSRTSGTFLLHFYKNDVLTGNYIDDYLEVIVEDEAALSDKKITAPIYAEYVPLKPAKQNKTADTNTQNSNPQKELNEQNRAAEKNVKQADTLSEDTTNAAVKTAVSNSVNNSYTEKNTDNELQTRLMDKAPIITSQNDESDTPDGLLAIAQKEYENKNYPAALKSVQHFLKNAISRIDEGLYLQGQILEAKSEVQNIKTAINSYDTIVKNWPASNFWEKAEKRSIFLKRFYINIR